MRFRGGKRNDQAIVLFSLSSASRSWRACRRRGQLCWLVWHNDMVDDWLCALRNRNITFQLPIVAGEAWFGVSTLELFEVSQYPLF